VTGRLTGKDGNGAAHRPDIHERTAVPVLMLFAQAREAAGTSRAEVAGETVGDVLTSARARFGPAFAAVLASSKVWVNGEPASEADPVSASDEVAVLPPVSGG
jgi:sulfur-carrier protein